MGLFDVMTPVGIISRSVDPPIEFCTRDMAGSTLYTVASAGFASVGFQSLEWASSGPGLDWPVGLQWAASGPGLYWGWTTSGT